MNNFFPFWYVVLGIVVGASFTFAEHFFLKRKMFKDREKSDEVFQEFMESQERLLELLKRDDYDWDMVVKYNDESNEILDRWLAERRK